MDIRVVVGDHNEYNVFTNSGVQLVGTQAAQLSFNRAGHRSRRRRNGTPIPRKARSAR